LRQLLTEEMIAAATAKASAQEPTPTPDPTVTTLEREKLGVRDDQINLEPNRPPMLGEQLRDASPSSGPG
jgi:hypothetical protein